MGVLNVLGKAQVDIKQWQQLKDEQFAEILKRSVEKVDLSNPDKSFTEAVYVIVPNPLKGEQLPRRAELTEDSLKGLALNQGQMSYNQLMASGKGAALILREGKRSMEFVFRSGSEMYLLNVDRMMNGLTKLLGFDKIERALGDALKEREARQKTKS